MAIRFGEDITCFYDSRKDEDNVFIGLLINKKDGSIVKPNDIYVTTFRTQIYKYVPEYIRIRTSYDESSVKVSCHDPDDCAKIAYIVYINDDGDIDIKVLDTLPKRLPKRKQQVIYDIIYKIVSMFLDFDPKKDTKETIRKKVWDIFNSI